MSNQMVQPLKRKWDCERRKPALTAKESVAINAGHKPVCVQCLVVKTPALQPFNSADVLVFAMVPTYVAEVFRMGTERKKLPVVIFLPKDRSGMILDMAGTADVKIQWSTAR